METITLDLNPIFQLTDEQFFQLCQHHRDYRFERTELGEIIIMTPTGGETGTRNSDFNYQLQSWNRKTKLGIVFDSSTGFKLPNGANRSPDLSWIPQHRWDALTAEQRQKFLPLCPDFVLELRSPSDSLKTLQNKMVEYIENGTKLGWLIDPKNRRVEIYRPNQDVEILDVPTMLSGEDILPEFILELTTIW
ncbi:Uma2 family endonuclease [Oscillatoriales cyanobacterium LEGE 11467]|uniref:Uma2 family endonuclease n=1 Tax=Zarconia navalis LEGE 11467 TaxID=1828826 RepID=A0A928VUX1_9CYAN|nr:Uma2 family endonuclease [Zarconia navalis]MBE9040789.1 Uma2 family endonuclease [Zarconia navalis LEGE 11467]